MGNGDHRHQNPSAKGDVPDRVVPAPSCVQICSSLPQRLTLIPVVNKCMDSKREQLNEHTRMLFPGTRFSI